MADPARCEAHIMLMDDRWGAFRDQCEGQAGHPGDHFTVMGATMPLGRLMWRDIDDSDIEEGSEFDGPTPI